MPRKVVGFRGALTGTAGAMAKMTVETVTGLVMSFFNSNLN